MFSYISVVNDNSEYNRNWGNYINFHSNNEYIKLSNYSSIFKAYNEGIKRSSFNYMVFVHQDCKIVDSRFELVIDKIFKSDNKIGAVFMVGSPIAGNDSWSFGGLDVGVGSWYDRRENNLRVLPRKGRILVGDGFCFVSRIKDLKFDGSFDTFHFYDIIYTRDLVKAGFKIVVPDIPLTFHASGGGRGNEDWKKWKGKLDKRVGKEILVLVKDKVVSCKTKEQARELFLR